MILCFVMSTITFTPTMIWPGQSGMVAGGLTLELFSLTLRPDIIRDDTRLIERSVSFEGTQGEIIAGWGTVSKKLE